MIELTDEMVWAFTGAAFPVCDEIDDDAARAGLAALLVIVERDNYVSRRATSEEITARPKPVRRLKSCVEAWPDCHEGDYDPACCRFPKSCSCTVYWTVAEGGYVTEDHLEPLT